MRAATAAPPPRRLSRFWHCAGFGDALRALHDVVDREWSAVASSVAAIEALYEDETFEAREDAALLASKVRARGEKESAKRRRGWERDADLVARDEDRARPDDGLATARPR